MELLLFLDNAVNTRRAEMKPIMRISRLLGSSLLLTRAWTEDDKSQPRRAIISAIVNAHRNLNSTAAAPDCKAVTLILNGLRKFSLQESDEGAVDLGSNLQPAVFMKKIQQPFLRVSRSS